MTGPRIRSVLLASNSSRPAFFPIHGFNLACPFRPCCELESQRRPPRGLASHAARLRLRRARIRPTHPGLRIPPIGYPDVIDGLAGGHGTHVSVRPTSPPTFRHSHLTAAARTNARAHRRRLFRAVAKVKDCQRWRWEHYRI